MSESRNTVITITQLNRYISQVLGKQVPAMWIKGEISNFIQAASGHWYFSLKDDDAQARAVMFRGRAVTVNFRPQNGAEVEVFARAGLYEPRGDYQLQVEQMRLAGQGSLHEKFLKIKEKLAQEGLFDTQRKKHIPSFIKTVGVVTSLGAAALQDVLTAIRRRAPYINVIIYPSLVQGREAPAALREALAQAKSRQEIDVLLLVRGGGSMEDLWAFNDELLARDIADFPIPVVSGVGHETDFTIADFVADVRAPTPTAAAELVSVSTETWLNTLQQFQQRLLRSFTHQHQMLSMRLDRCSHRLVSPQQRLYQFVQQHQFLQKRLSQLITQYVEMQQQRIEQERRILQRARPQIERYQQKLAQVLLQLQRALPKYLHYQQSRLDAKKEALYAYNPRAILERGYSITYNTQSHVIREQQEVKAGEHLQIELAKGTLKVVVLDE